MSDKKNCINCGKEISVTTGKKEKKYCDANCRQKYWQKTKKNKLDTVVIPKEEYEELIKLKLFSAKIIKNKEGKPEAEFILSSDSDISDGKNTEKVEIKSKLKNIVEDVINSNKHLKHKLFKEGDPKEGSAGFFMKYGVSNYDEIK